MMRGAGISCAACAALLIAPVAVGQRPPQVTRYTVEDGLAENRVAAVVQDVAGFLWLGTPRGLQRFDGHSFVNFNSLNPAAPKELSGAITKLHKDPGGNLWVGTPTSLQVVDPVLWSVATVPIGNLKSWAPDSAGRAWILDHGTLVSVSIAERPFSRTIVGDTGRFRTLDALATSRDGSLFALVGGRPVRVDPATGRTIDLPVEAIRLGKSLREDRRGGIWLAGSDGLEVLAPGAGRFRSIKALSGVPVSGVWPQPDGKTLLLTDDFLARLDSVGRIEARWQPGDLFGVGALPRDLTVDSEAGLWIPTTTSGLFRLDFSAPLFEFHAARSSPPLPLASDFIMAVHEEPDGTLWVGTFRGGAYRVSPDWSRVEAFRHGPGPGRGLPSDRVWAFAEDSQGRVWIGASGGICRAGPPGLHCYPVPAGGVVDIERDAAGQFWLAFGGSGVRHFDPFTGAFGPAVEGPLPAEPDFGIQSLLAEPDSGYLWLATVSALYRAPLGPGTRVRAEEFLRPEPQLHFMQRDRSGRFWLGTDAGLLRWNPARRTLEGLPLPELQNTAVYSMAEDRSGRLWIGTAHGLVRYYPEQGVARRFSREDGFLSGELNRRAALLRRNGRMVFGGVNGLTEFDPERITGGKAGSPVVLTHWRKVTAKGPVDAPLNPSSRLRLIPGDRAFSFEFTVLSYAPTLGRRYRYRLDGLSEDWTETTEGVVNFGTPKPGHYTFLVQTALTSEGEWSIPGSRVELEVVPPFWGTTWFRAIVVLTLAALAWAGHRWRLRHALAAERLRVRISRDLHDELGAGLSSIALMSDSAIAPEGLRRIGESARSMVSDLRDIVWAIDPEADRLGDVVTRMRDVADTLLQNLRVRFEAPGSGELTARIGMSARRDLLLLYKELLHNVARHARATEVRIDLVQRRDGFELVVADNGVGFSGNGGGGESGTGLRSMRERAARLGGEISFEGAPGRGTTARLVIRRT